MPTKTFTLPQLRTIVEAIVQPVVAELLHREAATRGAEILFDESQQVLRVLAEGNIEEEFVGGLLEREKLEATQLQAELRGALQQPLPPPTHDDVVHHTKEVALVMTSSWIETIRRALKARGGSSLELDCDVMVPHRRDIGDDAYDKLMQTLEPLVVSRDEAPEIMRELRRQLFSRADSILLPSGVFIQELEGRLVAGVIPTG